MSHMCNKCGQELCQNADSASFDVGTVLARQKEIEDQEPISFDFIDVVKDREDPWLDRKYE